MEFYVDVRCLVSGRDMGEAYNKVLNELHEYLLNSDDIREHDFIQIKQRRDDFYD